MTNLECAKAYRELIEDDRANYDSAMRERRYDSAVRFTQQIIEKCLKGILVLFGYLTEDIKDSHNLRKLFFRCKELHLIYGYALASNLDVIRQSYTRTRYPENRCRYDYEDAVIAGEMADDFFSLYLDGIDPDRTGEKFVVVAEFNIDDADEVIPFLTTHTGGKWNINSGDVAKDLRIRYKLRKTIKPELRRYFDIEDCEYND